MPHDGLAGVDLGYNMLNLTERISSSDTTLAEYAYLSDGPLFADNTLPYLLGQP